MPVIEIDRIGYPGTEVYVGLTDVQMRSSEGSGIFNAESPKVIRVALNAGYEPVSLMCEKKHINGDASEIIALCGDIPVYTAGRELLASLTGYKLTRGVLCAMRRLAMRTVADVCHDARRVAVIDDVCDATNIGAIFRSAAALGIDAVVLGGTACDPLNRRSVRVSMGSVFVVPWCVSGRYMSDLRGLGFKIVSLALSDDSVEIDDLTLRGESHLAIIVGSEGYGLPADIIGESDYVARIPMKHGVDSLNVAAAAAVAFWELRAR